MRCNSLHHERSLAAYLVALSQSIRIRVEVTKHIITIDENKLTDMLEHIAHLGVVSRNFFL